MSVSNSLEETENFLLYRNMKSADTFLVQTPHSSAQFSLSLALSVFRVAKGAVLRVSTAEYFHFGNGFVAKFIRSFHSVTQ
jgi:hypothetical protein